MAQVRKLKPLGLSKKEEHILSALIKGSSTPLELSRQTDISRTGIYAILARLKERKLVDVRVKNGKKRWTRVSEQKIEQILGDAKRELIHAPKGYEEVFGRFGSVVIVHRGARAVRRVIRTMLAEHSRERLYGFQGDTAINDWDKIFSVVETNRLNRLIKKNKLIVEAVLPEGWFERHAQSFGLKWARDFEGRTTRVSVINPQYFKHGGQLFIFKKSIYLLALGEELVIEIRNSAIQEMLLSLFTFVESHARLIDANELLRRITNKS